MSNAKAEQTKKPRKKTKLQKKKAEQKEQTLNIKVVQAPAARTVQVSQGSPKIMQNSAKLTRIKHREYIDNVDGNSVFTANRYDINPGMPVTFPWLSGVARNWEKYKFHSLRFLYIPRCSTATNGSIMMAVDYDAADASPISDGVMLAYDCSKDAPPWSEIILPCGKEKLQERGNYRYIRHAALALNLDVKTYDVGKFIVAVSDSSSTTKLGRIFVEYDVELFIPQVPSEGFEAVASANVSNGGTVNVNMPLGTNPTIAANSVGVFSNDGTHNTVGGVSPGTYSLNMGASGTGLGSFQVPTILTGPGTVATLNGSVTNSGGTSALVSYLLQNLGLNTIVSLPYLSAATTLTAVNARLNKVMADVQLP